MLRIRVGLSVVALLIGSLVTIGASLASTVLTPTPAGAASTCPGYGVLLARADGTAYVQAPGSASCAAELYQGSTSATHLNKPLIGVTALPSGQGYWLLAGDGGVFTFGQAQFYGSTGSMHLNAPIVGMASTPDGKGYWLVAADGGIFSFGDAQFEGSVPGTLKAGQKLNAPIVGMAADLQTGGYWVVAADGGVFAFGAAPFFGSMGGKHLNAPISFVTGTPDDGGYRMIASDGGVFDFGDAQFYGSAAAPGSSGWSALATTPDGGGYWLFSASGGSEAFGDAAPDTLGTVAGQSSSASVVGAATVSLGQSGDVTPSAADGYFGGVSCATATQCVAVGGTHGITGAVIELSTNGGQTFTTEAVPPTAPAMVAVDCNDATHCVAVGTTSAMVSNNGGLTWTVVSTPASLLTSVSCDSDSDCAAVGGGAGEETFIYSTNGGMTWANSAFTGQEEPAAGVACPAATPGVCVSAGETMSRSTDGGAIWTQLAINGGTNGNNIAAACTTNGADCLGIGPNPAGVTDPAAPGELLLSTNNGTSWTNDGTLLSPSTASIDAVACGGTANCMVVGLPPSTGGGFAGAQTSNGGSAWTSFTGPKGIIFTPDLNAPSAIGVTCVNASTCIVVGANSSGPVAFTTSDDGAQWSTSTTDQT